MDGLTAELGGQLKYPDFSWHRTSLCLKIKTFVLALPPSRFNPLQFDKLPKISGEKPACFR